MTIDYVYVYLDIMCVNGMSRDSVLSFWSKRKKVLKRTRIYYNKKNKKNVGIFGVGPHFEFLIQTQKGLKGTRIYYDNKNKK